MKKYIALLLMLLVGSPLFSQTAKHHHKTVQHKTVKHKAVKHKVVTKKHKKKTVVHHGRHKAPHHVAKMRYYSAPASPIFVDTKTGTATVEVKNGKLYVNDAAVYTLKNRKGEDQKIIINYPAPEPQVQTTPVPEPAVSQPEMTQAKESAGTPLLGVRTFDSKERGATIEDVLPGSPADDAGLWPGEVITRIDEQEIDNSLQLSESIKVHKVGDNIDISYLHFGETDTTKATLGDKDKMPDEGCGCRGMWGW